MLVYESRAALVDAVAKRFVTKLGELLAERDRVHVVLTGGSVGIAVLAAVRELDSAALDWSRVVVWWGDERWLPAADPDRNAVQATEALLAHIPLDPANVHPFPASDQSGGLDAAAAGYAAELAAAAEPGQSLPSFDITFLGVGPDGHVASLFPDHPGIQVVDATVVSVIDSPKPPPSRLSLTLAAINSSARLWLVVAGADKAAALGLALAGASELEVPVAGVEGKYRTVYFVDAAAAAEVPDDLIAAEY
ncbi:6-phosphogluconolactonase [soil metagenome]